MMQRKVSENAVYSKNFQVSEVDWYFPELGRTFFLHKFMEFLKKFRPQNARPLDIRDYLSVLLKYAKYHESLGRKRKTRAQN